MTQDTSVRTEIVVNAPIERAFAVFTQKSIERRTRSGTRLFLAIRSATSDLSRFQATRS